jgi:hypothetical protein
MWCTFRPCNWVWKFNGTDPTIKTIFGVYQCSRCKTISTGASRPWYGNFYRVEETMTSGGSHDQPDTPAA